MPALRIISKYLQSKYNFQSVEIKRGIKENDSEALPTLNDFQSTNQQLARCRQLDMECRCDTIANTGKQNIAFLETEDTSLCHFIYPNLPTFL